MHLIITRHGETVENVQGIIQGQGLQGTLTEKGIDQAKKLSLHLKDEQIDAIFSSDLARAADTAKEVAKYHPHAPFHLVKELREVDVGDLSGRKKVDVQYDTRKDLAESDKALCARLKKFLDHVYHQYKDKKVLFVMHNYAKRALLAVLQNKDHSQVKSIPRIGNTAITTLDVSESGDHQFHTVNCTKHLE